MTVEALPPAAVLLAGAVLVPLARGTLRKALVLALPLELARAVTEGAP